MSPRLHRPAPRNAQRGIALIVVLWLLALLTLLATTVLSMSVTHRRAAENLGDSIRARAIADGGLRLELLHLIAPTTGESGVPTAPNRQVQLFGVPVDVAIEREAGRIDLNTVKEPLLMAFFAANGWSEGDARAMAARIEDWQDPDDTPREGGAELREYLAAGRLQGPRNGPFESTDELRQVLGGDTIAPQLFDSLTVYSHLGVPDSTVATPAVMRALAWADQHQLEGPHWLDTAHGAATGAGERTSLIGEVVRLHACPQLRSQKLCRVAVVRLTGNRQTPFQIFLWADDAVKP
jgi:general secretion pathway protein K